MKAFHPKSVNEPFGAGTDGERRNPRRPPEQVRAAPSLPPPLEHLPGEDERDEGRGEGNVVDQLRVHGSSAMSLPSTPTVTYPGKCRM